MSFPTHSSPVLLPIFVPVTAAIFCLLFECKSVVALWYGRIGLPNIGKGLLLLNTY